MSGFFAQISQTFSSKREGQEGKSPIDNIQATIGSEFGKAKVAISSAFGIGPPKDAEPPKKSEAVAAFAGDKIDWRVKLSLPVDWEEYPIFYDTLTVSGGFVFPYTPTIMFSNTASYNTVRPIHSNYTFYGYQNSNTENITITSPFTVTKSLEGEYWISSMHYLRSVTKMAYGETSNAGAPPVIVKLNGYGTHIFKNVPVVITNFNIDLPQDVDYIYVKPLYSDDGTYVPTRSNVSVTVTPVYSRAAVEEFSLDKFVSGGYVGGNVGYL